MKRSVDYIIIGQGIAGSMLGWFLSSLGKKILIVDEFNSNSASRVASGIINPITGKRLVKSWKVDEIIPFAKRTYRELENELGIHIFFEKIICRIFSNNEDFRFFRNKEELGELPEYVKPLGNIPSCFNDVSFGGIEISGAYQLDYPVLLASLRRFFLEADMLLEEKFHFENLVLTPRKMSYNGIEAAKIIFCEGSDAVNNPYFKWLPFNLAKGEVMTVKMDDFPQDHVWYKGIFISPVEKNFYRVGATYEWNFENGNPSEIGKIELSARLRKAVNLPFEIIQQDAAIRPTVVDRRPLIGLHSDYNELGVFNGLGTKGASLAPYFAHQLAMHLVKDLPLDPEVNIKRFSNEPFFPGVSGKDSAKE